MAKRKGSEFAQWFGPILDVLRELGDSGKPREISDKVAVKCNTSPDDMGTTKHNVNRFYNQVAWARQYLVWEGLLDSSKRGVWELTEKGRQTVLTEKDANKIISKWVKLNIRNKQSSKEESEIVRTVKSSNSDGADEFDNPELIDVLRSLTPSGFEKVIRRLLLESGFDNVEVTSSGADQGVDGYGILKINPLISLKVIFQCKRYKEGNNVSCKDIGYFRSSMQGRAEKGIFITTSDFTLPAKTEATRDGADNIELVNGNELVEMFESVELGVMNKRVVYDVDLDYFKDYM